MSSWKTATATLHVQLNHDTNPCNRTRDKDPDAPLACAHCGNALWTHASNHATCTQFCWVTERSLSLRQIRHLRSAPDLPEDIHLACSIAINDHCFASTLVYKARQTCAAAINEAKRFARNAQRNALQEASHNARDKHENAHEASRDTSHDAPRGNTPESPRRCLVEHAHWDGPMICGNPLPCPHHGGR